MNLTHGLTLDLLEQEAETGGHFLGLPIVWWLIAGFAVWIGLKIWHAIENKRAEIVQQCQLRYKENNGDLLETIEDVAAHLMGVCRGAFTRQHLRQTVVAVLRESYETGFAVLLVFGVHFGWFH